MLEGGIAVGFECEDDFVVSQLCPNNVAGIHLLLVDDELQPPPLLDTVLNHNGIIALSDVHFERWFH